MAEAMIDQGIFLELEKERGRDTWQPNLLR
jgi:hypothetical protein